MRWIKPKDRLPKDKEMVLVRKEFQVDLACYNAKEQRFMLKDGGYYDKSETVRWMEMIKPSGETK